ncbi:hypothetical protein MITS9509_01316 [Synechococcus sp. MIT S9509]|nr:hypothetical protein MITS9509_01316 [Synechococcus sp. MIT S9509]
MVCQTDESFFHDLLNSVFPWFATDEFALVVAAAGHHS